jgi:hypothetical protein
MALLGLLWISAPGSAQAQEELTLPELEGLYRSALANYTGAFEALEVVDRQVARASQVFNQAINAGDENAMNRAFAENQRLQAEKWRQERRVEETAEALRNIRERLVNATAVRLDEVLAQADTATDPVNARDLATLVVDFQNRLTELRFQEDPPVSLEPEPDITAEPRDSPAELRTKANILDFRARQYEDQHDYYDRMLAGLLRDQSLLRRSNDFLADRARFDNTPVPVGAPGNRTTPPPGQVQPLPGADSLAMEGVPLTLDQRIELLEALKEDITERIESIRVKAADLRRMAGGVWA